MEDDELDDLRVEEVDLRVEEVDRRLEDEDEDLVGVRVGDEKRVNKLLELLLAEDVDEETGRLDVLDC